MRKFLEWEPIEEKYIKRMIQMHKRQKGNSITGSYVKRLKDAYVMNEKNYQSNNFQRNLVE